MSDNLRKFEAGPDPFGRKWTVTFQWLQTAISIRHSDSVDVKYEIVADDGTQHERVIALMHPYLLAVSKKLDRKLTDSWCLRLANEHLRVMIETWEDADKTILTPALDQVEQYARKVEESLAVAR
jgi:hypothetical protein